MVPNVGWSRSRRWLLETCARRYVLTYPGEHGRSGQHAASTPRLRLKRLVDGVRKDLFEDRSEGHAWSNRLHRVVLERRMEAAGEALNLDAVGRRREARREVFKMNLLFAIRGWSITFRWERGVPFPLRCVRLTTMTVHCGLPLRSWWEGDALGWCSCDMDVTGLPLTTLRPPSADVGPCAAGQSRWTRR